MRPGRGLALAVALALAGGCSKPPAPKTDAATERAEAHERARKDAFGTQVQALDRAKGMQEQINSQATSNVDRIEGTAK